MGRARIFLLLVIGALCRGGNEQVINTPQPMKVADLHLADMTECTEGIMKYCSHLKQNASDMALLECLLDAGEVETVTLGARCAHLIRQFKVHMTSGEPFGRNVMHLCKDQFVSTINASLMEACEREGYSLACLLEYKEELPVDSHCRRFITRAAVVAFSDLSLFAPFVYNCEAMVERFECGPLQNSLAINRSQGNTLECLRVKMFLDPDADLFDADCWNEVFRIAELQADDYHLDRPLYFACRRDHQLFCSNLQEGHGRVFECLMHHKNNSGMGAECVDILNKRASLLGREAASRSFHRACRKNIRQGSCMRSEDNRTDTRISLPQIIGCLSDNAELTPLRPACEPEVFNVRQMIMSNYRLSPGIVRSCHLDIEKFCTGQLIGPDNTVHCLMKHAQSRRFDQSLQPACKQELFVLMKIVHVGGDYRVDRVLHESCQEFIDGRCKRVSTEWMLSCLMSNLEDVSDGCSQHLLEVQYFIARDWTLHPGLYYACQKDAVIMAKCPQRYQQCGQLMMHDDNVLSCLYFDSDYWVSPHCTFVVRQVLVERASRVQLLPNIEENCLEALDRHCPVKPNDELSCLQQHIFDDDFKLEFSRCSHELIKLTEKMLMDTRLHQPMFRACWPVIGQYCHPRGRHRDEQFMDMSINYGNVMPCLTESKGVHEMSPQCRAHVVQFELIVSRRYEIICADDISMHCTQCARDKADVVQCLLTYDRSTLRTFTRRSLSMACREQVYYEYRQQFKLEVDHHKILLKSCAVDMAKHHCIKAGQTTVEDALECLRKRKFEELLFECQRFIFAREEVEMAVNSLDVRLQRECATEILMLCNQLHTSERALHCLKSHRRNENMTASCWTVVEDRMRQQAVDIFLQPELLNACSDEVEHFCDWQFRERDNTRFVNQETEGLVVTCLRNIVTDWYRYNEWDIHPDCKREVFRVIVESELDPERDPPFYKACKQTMAKHCGEPLPFNYSSQLECMKDRHIDRLITDWRCSLAMKSRTMELLTDIRLDAVLSESCSLDLQNFCSDVKPGVIGCLVSASSSTDVSLSNACRQRLDARRKLWGLIFIPGGLKFIKGGHHNHKSSSPRFRQRHLIFIMGILLAFSICLCLIIRRELLSVVGVGSHPKNTCEDALVAKDSQQGSTQAPSDKQGDSDMNALEADVGRSQPVR